MVPQTETKAGAGFKAGVKDYRLTYYTPDYVISDTDILAAFRMTPQPGVPPEECGAAVAAESSTGTWTTVWTDGLTSLDRYKGHCYDLEPVPGEENQYIAYVAYPIDLFKEGSVTNLFTSIACYLIVGNIFGFKVLHFEDFSISPAYIKTFSGPPHGIQVERDKLNKYGRGLLGCRIKPKLGLSAKNYGRAVYECLRGGLDFTKDDENVTSQPFMRWRDRFLFVAEAIYKAQAETGEVKSHYLNCTAGTSEEMIKRAACAKDFGLPIIMYYYLTGGFTSNTSLALYSRDNGFTSLDKDCELYSHTVIEKETLPLVEVYFEAAIKKKTLHSLEFFLIKLIKIILPFAFFFVTFLIPGRAFAMNHLNTANHRPECYIVAIYGSHYEVTAEERDNVINAKNTLATYQKEMASARRSLAYAREAVEIAKEEAFEIGEEQNQNESAYLKILKIEREERENALKIEIENAFENLQDAIAKVQIQKHVVLGFQNLIMKRRPADKKATD